MLSTAAALSITGSGDLDVSGASGTLSAATTVNGSGTLSVASGTNLTLSGVVGFGSPDRQLTRPGLRHRAGHAHHLGTTTIAAYGGNSELFLGGKITWVNTGTVNDSGFVYLNALSSDTVPSLTRQAPRSICSVSTLTWHEYQNGTDTFTNAGTLTSSSGTAVSDIWATTTNTGLISVGSGTLDFQNGLTSSGAVSLATGTTLQLDNGGTHHRQPFGQRHAAGGLAAARVSETTSGLAALAVAGGTVTSVHRVAQHRGRTVDHW